MFEDNQNQPPQAPSNLPTQEPDDMFAEVEKNSIQNPDNSVVADEPPNALEAGLLRKKEEGKNDFQSSPQQVSQSEMTYKMKEPVLGKVLLVIFLILILVGLGFGGWWFYNSFMKGSIDDTDPIYSIDNNVDEYQITEENKILEDTDLALEQIDETLDDVEENVEVVTNIDNEEISQEMDSDEILFGEPIDSDQDGLDDVRENELGTNPNTDDTDQDGLRDADEVLIWGTDPLLSDTDGDGYLDGEEIGNGYNPLGEGKLVNPIPVVIEEATTTK